MTSKEHANTLGLLFYIYVGFQLFSSVLGGIVVLFMFAGMSSEFANMPHRANEPDPTIIFGGMMVVMVFAFAIGLLMLIPKAFAAYGLRNGKSWARTLAIVGSILALFGFPIGTALGVYGLWFCFGDEGRAYFDGAASQSPSGPPPPPESWR